MSSDIFGHCLVSLGRVIVVHHLPSPITVHRDGRADVNVHVNAEHLEAYRSALQGDENEPVRHPAGQVRRSISATLSNGGSVCAYAYVRADELAGCTSDD